ncbi:hypothetical protein [Nostoc sp. FACHB-888]|uniref:hypothetical protein n=1 Tax=Nostoc sp. FACHB-888 TaxID=2692842 RepID=UPI001F54FD3E|nr:hypothetical protein [Nostoc sp. FACHB-888]
MPAAGYAYALREYIQIRSLETVKNLLQSLGKLNGLYLTAAEEKLLNVLESEYGKEITP